MDTEEDAPVYFRWLMEIFSISSKYLHHSKVLKNTPGNNDPIVLPETQFKSRGVVEFILKCLQRGSVYIESSENVDWLGVFVASHYIDVRFITKYSLRKIQDDFLEMSPPYDLLTECWKYNLPQLQQLCRLYVKDHLTILSHYIEPNVFTEMIRETFPRRVYYECSKTSIIIPVQDHHLLEYNMLNDDQLDLIEKYCREHPHQFDPYNMSMKDLKYLVNNVELEDMLISCGKQEDLILRYGCVIIELEIPSWLLDVKQSYCPPSLDLFVIMEDYEDLQRVCVEFKYDEYIQVLLEAVDSRKREFYERVYREWCNHSHTLKWCSFQEERCKCCSDKDAFGKFTLSFRMD